jgi:TP901 family phage tail tape measure protein
VATERIDIIVSENGSRTVKRNLEEIGGAAQVADRGLGLLTRTLASIGFVAIGKQVLDFKSKLAEISTQVDTTVFDMGRLENAALKQAVAFGSQPVTQAEALYEIISAGATSAADATDTLTASNKLAVAGATDVATAADGLTSVLNSYAGQIESAERASDILFIGVRNGKTRVEELASSIGRVTPLAAQMRVGFDDLVASLAALTKGGMSTANAVTGVQAILAAVAKPSSQATDLAKSLGLEFTASALQAKGFSTFMADVADKTGGATDKMALLFGGVEAIVPALALTGAAGKDWALTLKQMGTEGGAVQVAFDKMAASPGFQLQRVLAAMSAAAISLGGGLANSLVPVLRVIADYFDAIVFIAVGMTAAFAWSAIYSAVSGLIGPVIALEKALGAGSVSSALFSVAMKLAQEAVNGFTTALLANPFTALIVGVTVVIAAIIAFGDQIKLTSDGAVTLKDAFFASLSLIMDLVNLVTAAFATTWSYSIGAVNSLFEGFGTTAGEVLSGIFLFAKNVVNAFIGIWVFAWNTIKVAWSNFPGFFDVILTAVLNGAIAAAEAFVNIWQAPLRWLAGALSQVSQEASTGLTGFLDSASINIPRAKLNSAGKAAGAALKGGFQSAFGTDYLGNAGTAIIERARKNKGASGAEETKNKLTLAPPVAGSALDDLKKDKSKAEADGSKEETRAQFLEKVNRETENSIKLAQSMNFEWKKVDEDLTGIDERLIDRYGKKAKLQEGERLQLQAKLRVMYEEQDAQKRMETAYNSFKKPQEDYNKNQEAINRILKQFPEYADQGRRALRDLRIEYLSTKSDLASGIELGRLNVQKDQENGAGRTASAYQSEFNGANNALRDLQEKATALRALMQDDPINSGSYALRMRELGLEALQLQADLPGATAFDAMRAGLASFARDFKGIIPGLARIWGSAFQRIGDGAANALGRAIVYGENLGDALKDVAKSALSELIASLVKLGIQWLVMQVIGSAAQTAIAATGIAAGSATAAAWAPAAAAVSLATFGANAIPASAAIATTYALTTALSLAGGKGFREGGYTGNMGVGDVAGVVHGQEFVVNARATRQHMGLLEAINAGRAPGYQSGGYVRKAGTVSPSLGLGATGSIEPTNSRGGDTVYLTVDARGAEAGVDEKIDSALDAALPVFLAKARKQEATVKRNSSGRQRLGSGSLIRG